VSGLQALLLHVLLEFNCIRLGKGETMKSIMSDRSEVAEGNCGSSAATKLNCSPLLHDLGIFTSPAAAKWAEKLQLDLPIIQTVAKVHQTIVFLLILPVVQPRQFASFFCRSFWSK
jgi:hypothetical protein